MKLHKAIHFRTKADSFRKNYRKKKGAYEPASNVLHSGLAPQNVSQAFSIWFSIMMSLIIKGSLFSEDIISVIWNRITLHEVFFFIHERLGIMILFNRQYSEGNKLKTTWYVNT